ncbi:MAG: hypothetical protein GEU81_17795 [Nitriliruptorales bacterium]|nr:hypothetical protein [Nitriliruptorales bacterium]
MASELVDLSQPLHPGMSRVAVLPEVEITRLNTNLQTSLLSVPSHAGTHIDAPIHVIKGGKRIGDIELARFTGQAVVSTVHRAHKELITVSDVLSGGPEPRAGDTLIIHTGWSAHFDGEDYHEHPSLDMELAEWAVEQGLSMIAIDTINPDLPVSQRDEGFNFPVHRKLLGNDVLIAENLTNLDRVSGHRGRFHAYPTVAMPPGGDAGHARFVMEAPADQ